MMNISNHCFQRYHERVKGKETPFVDSLKVKYQEEIEKLLSSSTKKYSGIIGHSTRPVDVYVNKHGWVLITNDKEKLLITLYKVDLGIDNDELTKEYIKESLKKIDDLEKALLEQSVAIDKEKQQNRDKIAANEALIAEYTKTISDLKSQNDNYKDLNKVLDASLYKANCDLRDALENYMVKEKVKVDIDVK